MQILCNSYTDLRWLMPYRTSRGRAGTAGSGGSGMNSSSSPGGSRKRPCSQSPARQASFAASIRSRDEATKFHQM